MLLAASAVAAVAACIISVVSLRGDVDGFQAQLNEVQNSPTGGGGGRDLVYCTVRGDDACFGKQIGGADSQGAAPTPLQASPPPPTEFPRCSSDGSCHKGICNRQTGLCSECWNDGDCSIGHYCKHGPSADDWVPNRRGTCELCEGLRAHVNGEDPGCDVLPDGMCCEEAFLRQCPSDPGNCKGCKTNADCPASTFCGHYTDDRGIAAINATCSPCASPFGDSGDNDPTACDALDKDCCSPAFLKACPKDPARCWAFGVLTCKSHSDCPKGVGTRSGDPEFFSGEYCVAGKCELCIRAQMASSIVACDGIGGDCCSAEFQAQCPTDPFHCKACKSHADCPTGVSVAPFNRFGRLDPNDRVAYSEYCAKGGHCASCGSNITALVCDAFDDKCCTQTFIGQCGGNPDLHHCASSSVGITGSFEWKLSWAVKHGCTDAGSAAYVEPTTCTGDKDGSPLEPGMRTKLLVCSLSIYLIAALVVISEPMSAAPAARRFALPP